MFLLCLLLFVKFCPFFFACRSSFNYKYKTEQRRLLNGQLLISIDDLIFTSDINFVKLLTIRLSSFPVASQQRESVKTNG